MKFNKHLILTALFINQISLANLSGTFDTTFSQDGTTDGWLLEDVNDTNNSFRSNDVVVDSMGRIIVVGNFSYQPNQNVSTEYKTRVMRYLKNGQLDTSFGSNGKVDLDLSSSPFSEEINNKITITQHDAVLVGSSRLRCPTAFDSDCHFDARVDFINSQGSKVGSIDVPFDFATTFRNMQDELKDMVFVQTSNPEIGKLALAVAVERESVQLDIDYGIAAIVVDLVTGDLSMDTDFSGDGKAECHFDLSGGSRDRDMPEAIVWNSQNSTYIVGGTFVEGDYPSNYGENMGFCEFNQQGLVVRKWSTQDVNAIDVTTFERLYDMQMGEDANGTPSLYVTSNMYESYDFDLLRYQQGFLEEWMIDTSFGPNISGISTVGFSIPFIGDTNDKASELLIEKDGSLLISGWAKWSSLGIRSVMALAKFTQGGHLDTSWGVGQSGKSVLALSTSDATTDFSYGLAEDPKTQEIYVVGVTKDSDNSRKLGFLANIHNDVIFKSGFE